MLKLEARPAPSKAMSLLSPLLALAVTVLIGIALLLTPPAFGALAALIGLSGVFIAGAALMGAAGAWVGRKPGRV